MRARCSFSGLAKLTTSCQLHAAQGKGIGAPGCCLAHFLDFCSHSFFHQCSRLQEAAAEEEFGANLTPINNKRDFEALINGPKPVVVDFMAPWCGKCRMIAPFVDELAEKHPNMVSLA